VYDIVIRIIYCGIEVMTLYLPLIPGRSPLVYLICYCAVTFIAKLLVKIPVDVIWLAVKSIDDQSGPFVVTCDGDPW